MQREKLRDIYTSILTEIKFPSVNIASDTGRAGSCSTVFASVQQKFPWVNQEPEEVAGGSSLPHFLSHSVQGRQPFL